MFNKDSIFFVLGASFVLSFVLIVAMLFLLLKEEHHRHIQSLGRKYTPIVNMVRFEYLRSHLSEDFTRHLDEMGLTLIRDESAIAALLGAPSVELFDTQPHPFMTVAFFGDGRANYLHFQTPLDEFIIQDQSMLPDFGATPILLFFASVSIVMGFLSYITYRRLHPLRRLIVQVHDLGYENFDVLAVDKRRRDEVSLLSNALFESARRLGRLKEARNIFIRNIMHELKTPITKGKFLMELPHSAQHDEQMRKVFYRLEALINEFAAIEELLAQHQAMPTKEYFIEDIIEHAKELLMVDEEAILFEPTQHKIRANFKLLSVACKNLIDNALRHATNGKVTIEVEANAIAIRNLGKALEHPLEYYTEPFTKGSNSHDGFGLGLYIVHNIVRAHGFVLEYGHEEGVTSFRIVWESKLLGAPTAPTAA